MVEKKIKVGRDIKELKNEIKKIKEENIVIFDFNIDESYDDKFIKEFTIAVMKMKNKNEEVKIFTRNTTEEIREKIQNNKMLYMLENNLI